MAGGGMGLGGMWVPPTTMEESPGESTVLNRCWMGSGRYCWNGAGMGESLEMVLGMQIRI